MIDVTAAVMPGQPEEELTRRWTVSSSEVDEGQPFLDACSGAMAYAMSLMLQPDRVNEVKVHWIWL